MASEGEVGPGPGYLLSSQGSTVQGSGWGAGKSPRSLSSCSSRSRLPKGGRDFTKTWDDRACFSTPQGRQSCLLSEACPPSRMLGCGVAGPPCPSPVTIKTSCLAQVIESLGRFCLSREGSQSWVFALPASYPIPLQQPGPYHHPLHILLSISLQPWLTPNLWRTIKYYFYRKLFHRKCLFQKTKMPYEVSLPFSPPSA